jgi:hypothetical protein
MLRNSVASNSAFADSVIQAVFIILRPSGAPCVTAMEAGQQVKVYLCYDNDIWSHLITVNIKKKEV